MLWNQELISNKNKTLDSFRIDWFFYIKHKLPQLLLYFFYSKKSPKINYLSYQRYLNYKVTLLYYFYSKMSSQSSVALNIKQNRPDFVLEPLEE